VYIPVNIVIWIFFQKNKKPISRPKRQNTNTVSNKLINMLGIEHRTPKMPTGTAIEMVRSVITFTFVYISRNHFIALIISSKNSYRIRKYQAIVDSGGRCVGAVTFEEELRK
jgi:hypothetical protein